MPNKTLLYEKTVKAPALEVFRAFTNATTLREWLCDIATVSPRENGRLYLAWNSGDFVCGEYYEVRQGEKVSFNWRRRNDPMSTQVVVTMLSRDGKTQLKLHHNGVDAGFEWEGMKEALNHIWENGLENLVSVLETGEDLRFSRKPMMGITTSDFNDEIAKKLGVPVGVGIRLDDVIEDMGAKVAGLRPDDVIVEIAGRTVIDWASLADALHLHRAGDQVKVGFYRGDEKMTTTIPLSSRPIPEIPTSQKDLAEIVSKKFKEMDSQLEKLFADVTESEASYKSEPGEWSVKEIIAHLIHGERFTQNWIYNLLGGHEQFADDWGGNPYASVVATVAVYPTLLDLRQEYQRSMAETAALIEHLPDEFLARKGSYWRVAYNLMEDSIHFNSHVEQMRKLVKDARDVEVLG